MALTKAEKKRLVHTLVQELRKNPATIFVTLERLPVDALSQVRRELQDQGGCLRVVKKRLLTRALREAGWEVDWGAKQGAFAVAAAQDEVTAAKVLARAAREQEEGAIVFLGGILGEQLLEAEAVKALAELPSLDEQRAQLVGVLQGSVRQFIGVLQGAARRFLGVLTALQTERS